MPFGLLRTFIATCVAFGGIFLGLALGRVSMRHLNLLVYAASGVLLGITLFDILPDAKAILPWPEFLVAIVSGYALFWWIGHYVYHVCPACAISSFDEETTQQLGQTAVLLLVALSIHSIMDGVAVTVGDQIAGHPNLGVLFGISFHKLPEGLALILLLIGAGYRRRTALIWSLTVESTTLLGGALGVFALKNVPLFWLGLLFGHVGGGFLYLVTSTLSTVKGHQTRLPARSLVAVSGLAFLITSLILWAMDRVFR